MVNKITDLQVISIKYKYSFPISYMSRKKIPPSNESIMEKLDKVIPVNRSDTYRYVHPEEKAKQRTSLKIAIVLVIIAGVIGGLFLLLGNNKEVQTNITVPTITTDTGSNDALCNDDCKLEEATKTTNAATCQTIYNESKKQDCLAILAPTTLDACISLTDYAKKKECIKIHAKTTENVAICDHLEEEDKEPCIRATDSCYYEPEEKQALCKALVKNDAAFCNNNEECIISFAQTTKAPAACNELSSRIKKNVCSSLALMSDECEFLPNLEEKNACREIYAIRSNQSDECTFITDDTNYAVNCYAHFAKETMNVSICTNVDEIKRAECYRKYSENTGDFAGCIAIDQFAPTTKQHCFIETSKLYGNPQGCEYLTFEPSAREICFRAAIQDNIQLRADTCEGLTSEDWSIRCYTNAAKLERDITICDRQTDEADRTFCRNNYK